MSTYGFRVQFHLPIGTDLDSQQNAFEIILPEGHRVILKSAFETDTDSLQNINKLVIAGSGFSTKEEAFTYGRKVKNALILCGSTLKMGIDAGKDNLISGAGLSIREKAEISGIRLLNEIHGLSVFPEDMRICPISVSADLTVGKPVEIFISKFVDAYQVNPKFNEKQLLAFELYTLSHFESSLRARFLTLISVIECLVVHESRPEGIIKYLSSLINLTKATLDDKNSIVTVLNNTKDTLNSKDAVVYLETIIELTERQTSEVETLVGGLSNLQKESITNSCKNLVKQYLGEEKAKFFKKCYKIRGALTHSGNIPKDIDFDKCFRDLDEIVSKVLFMSVQNTPMQASLASK